MKQHTRYQLVDTAVLGPGVDFITKSPTGPFIDAGVDIDTPGSISRLYLSVETIREMAQIAGLFDLAAPELLEETQAYQNGYADALKEALGERLVDIADRLGFVADRLGSLVLADLVDAPIEPGDVELVSAATGVIELPGDGTGESGIDSQPSTSRQSTRPRGNQRPAGLPGNTGDDPTFRI